MNPRPLNRIDLLALLVFLIFGGWLFGGYAYPDPYLLAQSSWITAKALPLAGLFLYVLLFLLLMGLRTGRLSSSSFFLLVGGLGVGALFLFPFGSEWFYSKRFSRKLDGYHAILQLSPPAYQPRGEGKNIFCLGGSTTAWADSEGQDWPSRVQQQLRVQLGSDSVHVHNLGKEWYTTLHTLVNYEANLRHHKPDTIVVMHGVNDLLMNADFSYFSVGPFREDYGHFLGPIKHLIKRETLVQRLRGMLGAGWYHTPRKQLFPDSFPGLKPFVRNLHTIIDLAQADQTKVILMTQPYFPHLGMTQDEEDSLYMLKMEAVGPRVRWSLDAAIKGFAAYNNAVREVARERKVALIDLESALPKEQKYFSDDVHYSDEAYPLLSEYVAREIASSDTLESL